MIRRLTGTIVSKTELSVVVEVGGIGYLVFTPQTHELPLNEPATLHTYLAVRENALDLYGFTFEDELELFIHLLDLPKIGPKSALQILTQASLELIKTAVANNDPSHLSKMSGMGKKTAEKVVAGLTDIFEKHGLALSPQTQMPSASNVHMSDTIDALVALGYPEHDARKTVQAVLQAKPELTNANDILKESLRQLS